MTQEELFIKNLSFVENLEMQAINAMIAKYIFKAQVDEKSSLQGVIRF